MIPVDEQGDNAAIAVENNIAVERKRSIKRIAEGRLPMIYKGFDIETIEDEPGKFKAVIRRANGATVRTAVPAGPDVPAITTQLYAKAEDAMAQAKQVIDAGGIL